MRKKKDLNPLSLFKWIFEQTYICIRVLFPVYNGVASRALFLISILGLLNLLTIINFLQISVQLRNSLINILLAVVFLSFIFVIFFIKKEYFIYLDEQVSRKKTKAILFTLLWFIISIFLWAISN